MASNSVINELKNCTQLQYNGQLIIKSSKGQNWTFYYRLGRIVWATGSVHPYRRWRRHMAQHCPQVDVDKLQIRQHDISIPYWDYHLLEIFHKRQIIQREQIQVIVESTIAELLFDLAQHTDFVAVSCDRNQDVILETPVSFTSADLSVKQVQDSWKIWSEAGLANFSPDSAPILRRPEQLQQQVSPSVYTNFATLMNGKHTLRDLAAKMKQNVLPVTRSLLPYILKGIIELIEVPDLPLLAEEVRNSHASTQAKKINIPLVACVDDSPQVCKMLEEIVTSHGLRFLKIQDPIQALHILIQNKPDLIFLDLVMPVASGYEICTQLRRVSAFANTPVIILTGNDGLLDRVRAKVVGSTDFLTKPVANDKVMNVLRKYLPMQTSLKVAPKKIHDSSSLKVCH